MNGTPSEMISPTAPPPPPPRAATSLERLRTRNNLPPPRGATADLPNGNVTDSKGYVKRSEKEWEEWQKQSYNRIKQDIAKQEERWRKSVEEATKFMKLLMEQREIKRQIYLHGHVQQEEVKREVERQWNMIRFRYEMVTNEH